MRGGRHSWFHAAQLGSLSLTGMAGASPLQSLAELKRLTEAESSLIESAVHLRLERESAGDLEGARLAARDAATHRAQFLELARDLERRLSPLPATLSVVGSERTTARASFLRAAAEATHLSAGQAEAGSFQSPRVPFREWDMYRPRALVMPPDTHERIEVTQNPDEPAPQSLVTGAGDLYSTGHDSASRREIGVASRELSARAESGEAPRTPFLVYRDRPSRDATRE